jgi:hypothetical protein
MQVLVPLLYNTILVAMEQWTVEHRMFAYDAYVKNAESIYEYCSFKKRPVPVGHPVHGKLKNGKTVNINAEDISFGVRKVLEDKRLEITETKGTDSVK